MYFKSCKPFSDGSLGIERKIKMIANAITKHHTRKGHKWYLFIVIPAYAMNTSVTTYLEGYLHYEFVCVRKIPDLASMPFPHQNKYQRDTRLCRSLKRKSRIYYRHRSRLIKQ